jgi:hypothetical protein
MPVGARDYEVRAMFPDLVDLTGFVDRVHDNSDGKNVVPT